MWIYNNGGRGRHDSFSGRHLRPIVPRSSARDHNINHLLGMVEQSKRELVNTQQVMVSSRWSPTREQLQTLEELYRRGTRTPSSDQIHQITSQLRRYGKIEAKNVFYWFQNHKARERLKRRRREHQTTRSHNSNPSESREPTGSKGDVGEVEQQTNCSEVAEVAQSSMRELNQCTYKPCRYKFSQ